MLSAQLSPARHCLRHVVGRTARTLSALLLSAGLLTACTATEAPTSPGRTPGGSVPVQPSPTTNGALALTVSGLPFGVTADVTVSGPSGFSRTLTGSSTLAELSPGRYTVSANTVRVASGPNAGVYAPSAASQAIDVGGGPPTSVSVAYAPLAAIVDVVVTGLPQGVASLVTLTPPTGADIIVTIASKINPALTGRWLMTARRVPDAGFTYTPSPVSGAGTAVAGDTLRFPVVYTLSTGALAVAVTGLPSSATAAVAVTGPDGFSRTLTGTATITDLTPGNYTVTAPPLTVAGISYAPSASTQQITVSASLVAAPAVIAYGAQVGALAITSTGLPTNAQATYTITGSNATRTITGDATIDSLVPGSYTVTASSVTSNGFAYAPSTSSTVVTIAARATATVRFTYGVTTGVLHVNASGLPNGSSADISITGPTGFARNVTSTTTLSGLTPGRYIVTARDVRLSSGSYVATPASQSIDIVSGGAIITANVSYAPLPAVVEVSVGGLSVGSAAITLTPPTGQDIAVTGTTRIAPATAGLWQLTASPVINGGYSYTASPATAQNTVALGDTLRFAVQYTLTTGAIAVAVGGLPQGASGSVNVVGPNNYKSTANITSTLVGLTPGTYTITAAIVTVGGLPYVPTPATQSVTVSASLAASPAQIDYAVPGGRIAFNLTGMPAGIVPTFTLSGANGTSTISGTTVLTLPAGSYTVTANTVSGSGVTYTPTPASRSLTVNVNSTTFAAFTYASSGAAATGRLAFNVSGLPANTNPSFSLVGVNGTTTIIGTATVDPVISGSYTLTANNLTSGGTTYVPAPSSLPITINTGTTTTATIAYAPGTSSGGLNVAVENVYLTQATQRLDGSVTLVANRDALLRVFVTATTANSARPDVRVRIYDGAIPLQTITITAPEQSVRTTSSEGVLTSTWNTLVPAVNVRPTMRVLVDVDPNASLTETDRSDNIWPRTGTSQAISVAAVPAFVVRFVPVTVAGLTGSVSESNKENFLTTTRRYMPIRDIVSDVRGPFTSSAPVLQSTDGNSAWLQVLSELNALRSTDGAPNTMHYYGVVKVNYSSGVAGYGYVPGRAAIGWDYLPSGDGVAVHEWGHNFSRPHTPCATAGDDNYPYAGGVVGMYGWNSATNALVPPTATDVMGYCNNQWISDWTWSKVLEYRQTSGIQASAMRAAASGNDDGLLVWGRVVDGRVILEPSFRVRAPATPIPSRGSHRAELLDASGGTLLDLPITADRVDHETVHDERQFAVVVRWTPALEQALARVRVSDVRMPFAAATRASVSATVGTITNPTVTPTFVDPAASVSAVDASHARIRWNTQAYPMAMVRDATTGAVMGFVRNSGDAVTTNGRPVEVVYSDGVRSVVRR